jgi:hypothetical protein
VVWSLVYAALGVYWAVSGRGVQFASEPGSNLPAPAVAWLGPGVAWLGVILAGIPAAALGAVMLSGVRGRVLRPLITAGGALLAIILLLLMTDINLLILLAYVPYFVVFGLLGGADVGQVYLQDLARWTTVHGLLCLVGGFLWLGATVCYARRSGDACLYCGRRDGPEGWTSPNNAARWGRIAVYVSLVVPVVYAVPRYIWALGFPLGMSEESFRVGQENGMWTSGLFLATFGLVGAVLTLGLTQRWGEVFPRWMIGLAGRRVPIALAVVPALLVSVLLIVGGIAMGSAMLRLFAESAASVAEIVITVGPITLFPVWGVALAVAALGYYYRRRGPCRACGRGASAGLR